MFKCKKIKNVEKSICTCEQKIAYNFAFTWADTTKRRLKECKTRLQESDVFQCIYNYVLREIREDEKLHKYNVDAIMVAFRQGFESYCNSPFIATSYEQIGRIFRIPYPVL